MERIKLNIQKFADKKVEVEFAADAKKLKEQTKQARDSIRLLETAVKSLTTSAGSFGKTVFNVGKSLNTWNIDGLSKKIKSLGKTLYNDFLSKAIDTSEELNLFNVVFDNMEKNGKETFSELGKRATKFQNDLNEAFGTNKKETMRYQGLFQAMGESAGIKEEIANVMSENMTKLAYDLASLYNTTETRAAESLRAGVYAGQTKPLVI